MFKESGIYLLLATVTLAVYLNSFPGAFHFDDFPLMLESPMVAGESFPYLSFLEHYGGRPLTLWTFHLNYKFSGAHPFSYHLTNVILHTGVVLLLFTFVRRFSHNSLPAVTRALSPVRSCPAEGGRVTSPAFAAALLFAIHPLQTQAVNYIWSRSVLLMGLFVLAALLTCKKYPWLCLVFLQLAIWSRVEAIIAVVPLIWLSGRRRGPLILAGANAIAVALFLFRQAPEEMAWTYTAPLSYWMLSGSALWKYLGMMVWPTGLTIDHQMTVPLWLSVAALPATAGLLSGLWLLATRGPLRNFCPQIAWGMLWTLLFLAPSLLIPNSDLFSEHRSYLALAGFAAAGSFALFALFKARPVRFTVGLLVPLILLSVLTVRRNHVWGDDIAVWSEAAELYPENSRAHYNLAVSLIKSDRLTAAETSLERASTLQPNDDYSYAALAYCAQKRQNNNLAIGLYRRALSLNPDNEYAQRQMEGLSSLKEDSKERTLEIH